MSNARWKRIIQHATRLPVAGQPHRSAPGHPIEIQGEGHGHFRYSGACHDRVPRALLLDRRLTPLERNAWLVIRLLSHESAAAQPHYGDLQNYLSTVPGGTRASRETVARVLSLLRLTRWLSRVSRGRDAHTGQLQKAVYVLYDEPLSPAQALAIDPHYSQLIQDSLVHAARAVRQVAERVLDELKQDPAVGPTQLPTHRARRPHRADQRPGPRTVMPAHDSEPGDFARFGIAPARVRNHSTPGSESESSLKSTTYHSVRNPNSPSTVRTDTSIDTCTVPRAQEDAALGLCHEGLNALKLTRSARRQVTQALLSLPPAQRQAVLDEAAARCRAGGIREPAAYLTALIQRARHGEFKLWAAAGAPVSALPAIPPSQPPPPERPAQPKRQPGDPVSAQVQVCLDELRQHSRCRRETGSVPPAE